MDVQVLMIFKEDEDGGSDTTIVEYGGNIMRKLIVLEDTVADRLYEIAKSKGLTVVSLIRMILMEYVNSAENSHSTNILPTLPKNRN